MNQYQEELYKSRAKEINIKSGNYLRERYDELIEYVQKTGNIQLLLDQKEDSKKTYRITQLGIWSDERKREEKNLNKIDWKSFFASDLKINTYVFNEYVPAVNYKEEDEINNYYYNIDVELAKEKYLATKGKTLFRLIDMAEKLKPTKNNYNITNEQINQIQDLLKNSLNEQLKIINKDCVNNDISLKKFDRYVEKYKEYQEKIIPNIASNWEKKEQEKERVKLSENNTVETRKEYVEKINQNLIK